MDVGSTDTAAIDLDVNVSLLELLRFELGRTLAMARLQWQANYFLLLKVHPVILGLDHKTLECVWITHNYR